MAKIRWEIRLLHNGRVLLEGGLDELHELGNGYTRCYQFDVDGSLELRIIKEIAGEVKPIRKEATNEVAV